MSHLDAKEASLHRLQQHREAMIRHYHQQREHQQQQEYQLQHNGNNFRGGGNKRPRDYNYDEKYDVGGGNSDARGDRTVDDVDDLKKQTKRCRKDNDNTNFTGSLMDRFCDDENGERVETSLDHKTVYETDETDLTPLNCISFAEIIKKRNQKLSSASTSSSIDVTDVGDSKTSVKKSLNTILQKTYDPQTNLGKIVFHNEKMEKKSFEFKNLKLNEYLHSDDLLNRSHFILSQSGGGKTMFTTFLIYSLVKSHPDKRFAIIILSGTEDAKIKLLAINEIFNENLIDFETQVVKFSKSKDDFKELKALYEMHQQEYNARLQNAIRMIKNRRQKEATTTTTTTPVLGSGIKNNNIPTNIKRPASAAILSQPTHYIYLFDDCQDLLSSGSEKNFFSSFCSNHRQYNITSFYNAQDIGHVHRPIKTNLATFLMVGEISKNDIDIIFGGMHTPSKIFDSPKDFFYFYKQKLFAFKPHTLFIFRSGQPYLFCYKLNSKFVNEVAKFQQEVKIDAGLLHTNT